MQERNKKIIWIVFLSAVFVLIDQVAKYIVLRLPSMGEDFFSDKKLYLIELHKNTGLAFGVDLGMFWNYFLIIVVIAALIFVFVKEKMYVGRFGPVVGLALVFGGAFGNIIDRWNHGYVIDFVKISILPIFNLADVFILVGVIVLFICILKTPDKPKKAPQSV